MTDPSPPDLRKGTRVGHTSERGAVNAARTVFEAHGLVVDEIDGRSDYGRDLIVDLTETSKITGGVIGVQVKGNKRFIRDGDWEMPATAKDLMYWAESTVPVVGVLWDPDSHTMRWSNLTAHARTDNGLSPWPGHRSRPVFDPNVVLFPADQTLDATSVAELVHQMQIYLRQSSSRTLLGLFGADVDQQRHAIRDCWSLGRNDARAFKLLRRALPTLDGVPLVEAIATLSHLTPHPDIFWHARNWVPREVEEEVTATFRWSAEELLHLVGALERLEGGPGWERGGIGQCLWCILAEDKHLAAVTLPAISLAVANADLDTALRILIIHQWISADPLIATRAVVDACPGIEQHEMLGDVVEMIERDGRIDVY